MQKITITHSDGKRFSNETEGKAPTTLYQGRNFEVIQGQERASLARIELFMHYFLANLPPQEQYALVKETHDLFKVYGYRFQKEPLFPLKIAGDSETVIHVQAHAILHSDVLDPMMVEDPEDPPAISLPTGFSAGEFETQLNCLTQNTRYENVLQWTKMQAAADRILYSKIFFDNIEQKRPVKQNTLEELRQALSALRYDIDPTRADFYASDYLNGYIQSALNSKKTIKEICKELEAVTESLSQYNIHLKLNFASSAATLTLLATVIPKVTALSMDLNSPSAEAIQIPENMLANLTHLTLSGVNLVDYSVLDNHQKLQELILTNVNTLRVPVGCSSLRHFTATDCPIKNFSGLDNLPNLQSYHFENLRHLTGLPTGCEFLQSAIILSCPALADLNDLHNLKHLKSYRFSNLPLITSLPTGCRNLNQVNITCCPLLYDFSGLTSLPHLTTYTFGRLPRFTTVPQNCHNLKYFHAFDCQKLSDFSGLNSLSNLTNCTFKNLPLLTAIPYDCHNLLTLNASTCPQLEDSSGLSTCHKLRYFTLKNTPISTWQPNHKKLYLKSLFPEQQEEDERAVLEMIALLSDKSTWNQFTELVKELDADTNLTSPLHFQKEFPGRLDLNHPVLMTPELECYYLSVTNGRRTLLTQKTFLLKLNEILNTIRGAE